MIAEGWIQKLEMLCRTYPWLCFVPAVAMLILAFRFMKKFFLVAFILAVLCAAVIGTVWLASKGKQEVAPPVSTPQLEVQ